jgi:hypothetical protein
VAGARERGVGGLVHHRRGSDGICRADVAKGGGDQRSDHRRTARDGDTLTLATGNQYARSSQRNEQPIPTLTDLHSSKPVGSRLRKLGKLTKDTVLNVIRAIHEQGKDASPYGNPPS